MSVIVITRAQKIVVTVTGTGPRGPRVPNHAHGLEMLMRVYQQELVVRR